MANRVDFQSIHSSYKEDNFPIAENTGEQTLKKVRNVAKVILAVIGTIALGVLLFNIGGLTALTVGMGLFGLTLIIANCFKQRIAHQPMPDTSHQYIDQPKPIHPRPILPAPQPSLLPQPTPLVSQPSLPLAPAALHTQNLAPVNPQPIQSNPLSYAWQAELRRLLPAATAPLATSTKTLKRCEDIIKDHVHELNQYMNGNPSMGTILHYLAKIGRPLPLIAVLAHYNIDFSIRDTAYNNTALIWAIANANNDMALEIIQFCPPESLNCPSMSQNTALHLIVGKGYDACNADRRALRYPNYTLMERIVERGANVNLRDKNGNTPLHLACVRHDAAMIAYLLAHGANRNLPNNAGLTPLALIGTMHYEQANAYIQQTISPILLDPQEFNANRQPSIDCFSA